MLNTKGGKPMTRGRRSVKPVYFGPADAALKRLADDLGNFSAWVKAQLASELNARQAGGLEPQLVALVEKAVEARLAEKSQPRA
jgi:hypothetical protein